MQNTTTMHSLGLIGFFILTMLSIVLAPPIVSIGMIIMLGMLANG